MKIFNNDIFPELRYKFANLAISEVLWGSNFPLFVVVTNRNCHNLKQEYNSEPMQST